MAPTKPSIVQPLQEIVYLPVTGNPGKGGRKNFPRWVEVVPTLHHLPTSTNDSIFHPWRNAGSKPVEACKSWNGYIFIKEVKFWTLFVIAL